MPAKPELKNLRPNLHANMSAKRILHRAEFLMRNGMQYTRAAIRKAAEGNLTRGQGKNYYRAMAHYESAVANGVKPGLPAIQHASRKL